jgi:hypothetical protein
MIHESQETTKETVQREATRHEMTARPPTPECMRTLRDIASTEQYSLALYILDYFKSHDGHAHPTAIRRALGGQPPEEVIVHTLNLMYEHGWLYCAMREILG